ncbi:uncharacterized protein LOC113309583 isoform X4 [Papaver somniferum]|uniref:uncharacterized protein LOC113309583 isoform X4 n=1 Tax=Papaver somniferum TaxID=3469 RepID=UPI000E7013FA|nr:uncharacterized protein LOC113309583 isoform X4 [Papaver somniferum]
MVKHRDKDAGCNESSDNDDFVKPLKKTKTIKKTEKPKTNSTKPFRANFGPLHDLFRDLENKGQLLTKELIKALEATPFRDMVRVFIDNKISKDELCKSNHGLEMLIHTFTKTKDGQYGFNLVEGHELFISTPEDMVVDLGLQIIENGIEYKLINERKVTPSTNDLCIRYKFGETSPPVVRSTEVQVAIIDAIKNGRVEDFVRLVVFYMSNNFFHKNSIESSKGDVRRITGCTFYLLYWFAEHSSLVPRRGGAESIVPDLQDGMLGIYRTLFRYSKNSHIKYQSQEYLNLVIV